MFVITGGGTGIGKALASSLANRGKRVLVVGRRKAMLQALAQESSLISYCTADIATETGRQILLEALEAYSELDGLVHSAATIHPVEQLPNIHEAAWREAWATNVDAPLFLNQALREKLKMGRVLQIGSGAAYFPIAGWSAYCASKAASSMLTRCWQEEKALTIASVMPGVVNTDMLQAGYAKPEEMKSEQLDFYYHMRDSNHLLEPEMVGLFLTWLLLDIDRETYTSQEWDIYDESHHSAWLPDMCTAPKLDVNDGG